MDGTVLVADDDRTIRTVLTQALTRADAGNWLEGHGALLRTGPTGTNVNDFRAVLVLS